MDVIYECIVLWTFSLGYFVGVILECIILWMTFLSTPFGENPYKYVISLMYSLSHHYVDFLFENIILWTSFYYVMNDMRATFIMSPFMHIKNCHLFDKKRYQVILFDRTLAKVLTASLSLFSFRSEI